MGINLKPGGKLKELLNHTTEKVKDISSSFGRNTIAEGQTDLYVGAQSKIFTSFFSLFF